MESIKVIYWSGTGNTEQMAEAVAQGIEKGGAAADVREVSEVSAEILKGENVFALGCPAMGAEVLEEDNMEPFMSELEGELEGRTVGLFGSYGWGDGEWMRDWEKRVTGHGVVLAEGEVLCADRQRKVYAAQADKGKRRNCEYLLSGQRTGRGHHGGYREEDI